MALLELCPLSEEPCNRSQCKRLASNDQEPVCMRMVNYLKDELAISTIKQYLDPENKKQYQVEYINKTRIVQEVYDFSLNEFLLLLVRVGQDFNGREVVNRYLGSQRPGTTHKTS